MGQGRDRAREWLEQRPALMERLRLALLKETSSKEDLGDPSTWQESRGEAGGESLPETEAAA